MSEALSLILSFIGVHMYDQQHNGELDELVLEIEAVLENLDEEEPEVEPGVVVVDILLSLMAQSSALLREVVKRAFKLLAPSLTLEAINSLVLVLLDGGSGPKEEELEEEEEVEEEVEEEEEEEVAEPVKKKRKKREAAESDSDDDFEEGGAALMEQFLKIKFQSRRENSKKGRRLRKLQDVHFKLRVLDLVEIVVLSPCNYSAFLPLSLLRASVKCLKRSGELAESKALFERLSGIQSKLYKTKTLPSLTAPLPNLESIFSVQDTEDWKNEVIEVEQQLFLLFQGVLHAAQHAGTQDLAGHTANALNFVLRLSNKSNQPLPVSVFCSLMEPLVEEWLTKRGSKVTHKFFQVVLKHPTYAKAFFPALANLVSANKPRGAFEKMQATNLLHAGLKTNCMDASALPSLWACVLTLSSECLDDFESSKKNGLAKPARVKDLADFARDLSKHTTHPTKDLNIAEVQKKFAMICDASKSASIKSKLGGLFALKEVKTKKKRSSSVETPKKVKKAKSSSKKSSKKKK